MAARCGVCRNVRRYGVRRGVPERIVDEIDRVINTAPDQVIDAPVPGTDARSDQVYLKDGQRLVGTLNLERISFRASFGLAALPVADVDVLILGDDAHYLDLRNGDRLTGAAQQGEYTIDVRTNGVATVPAEDARFVIPAGDR